MTGPVGTVEGLRAHMIRAHGIDGPDEALEFALRRARSYSGSDAGVYAVAAKWVKEAAEESARAAGRHAVEKHGDALRRLSE